MTKAPDYDFLHPWLGTGRRSTIEGHFIPTSNRPDIKKSRGRRSQRNN